MAPSTTRIKNCERSRTYILSSTSEMSQVECGHPIVSYGSQHVTFHVPLTLETKVSIDKELLMKMPKRATLMNAACPARDNTDLKTCGEQSVVIMSTPGQNVNVVAELVFDVAQLG